MKESTKEALRLLKVYTGGHCGIWDLAGRSKATVRQHIMAVLLGVNKVPQAKAGISAMRSELYKQLEIDEKGLTIAEAEKIFWNIAIKAL